MANSYIYNLTDSRWTDGNTTYNGVQLTVTSTNSHANSNLLKFTYNSDVNFRVRRDGAVFANSDMTVTSNVTANIVIGKHIISSVNAPASSSSNGVTGEIRWDANYIYICSNTNTWVRATLATW